MKLHRLSHRHTLLSRRPGPGEPGDRVFPKSRGMSWPQGKIRIVWTRVSPVSPFKTRFTLKLKGEFSIKSPFGEKYCFCLKSVDLFQWWFRPILRSNRKIVPFHRGERSRMRTKPPLRPSQNFTGILTFGSPNIPQFWPSK